MDDIGLLRFESLAGFARQKLPQEITIYYYGTPPINIKFTKENDNQLEVGQVILSKVGQELAPICGSHPIPEFIEYVLNQWIEKGYEVYSPWPNKSMERDAK